MAGERTLLVGVAGEVVIVEGGGDRSYIGMNRRGYRLQVGQVATSTEAIAGGCPSPLQQTTEEGWRGGREGG